MNNSLRSLATFYNKNIIIFIMINDLKNKYTKIYFVMINKIYF